MNFPVRLGSRGINGSLGGIRAPKPRLRPAGRPCPYPPQTALWSPLGTLVRSNRLSLPRSPGCVYPPFLPGDASLALKNGPTPGLAPAGKFSSRIRILQFSTGKITTTREHSCQFGETSYSVFCPLYMLGLLRNQSGDHRRVRLGGVSPRQVGPPSALRSNGPLRAGFMRKTGVSGTRTPTPKRAVTPGPVPMSPQVSHTPSKEGSRGLCIVSQDPPLKTHLTAGFMRKWVLNWGSLRVRQPASLGLKLGG